MMSDPHIPDILMLRLDAIDELVCRDACKEREFDFCEGV